MMTKERGPAENGSYALLHPIFEYLLPFALLHIAIISPLGAAVNLTSTSGKRYYSDKAYLV